MIVIEYDDLPFLSSNKVNKREIASLLTRTLDND